MNCAGCWNVKGRSQESGDRSQEEGSSEVSERLYILRTLDLEGFFYKVEPVDAPTFAAVAALLALWPWSPACCPPAAPRGRSGHFAAL